MLNLFKQFKNAKAKNTLNLLPLTGDKGKNITLYNKYIESTNQDGNLIQRKKIGETRHYPPATKEWVNSTYSYNKNYTKTLPVADNVVNKLIKGYLNMNPLINNRKSKRVEIRFKRLSLNKILVSKAEVKHTNNKVIVTVYLYNRNKKFFLYKLKNLYMAKALSLNNTAKGPVKALSETNPILEVNYLKRKLKFISLRAVKLINKAKKHQNLLFKTLYWDNNNFLHYKNKYYKNFIKDAYEIELLYMYYIKMLSLNNNKFKNWFLLGLKKAISKLYNKKVEFNFVSLKYLHLNSDIFTESIVTRIRNRENALLGVLNRALRLAKIPSRNHNLNYGTNVNNNAITLDNRNKPFSQGVLITPSTKNYTNDILHVLLYNLFGAKTIENNKNAPSLLKAKNLNNKQVNILDAIKHKTVMGVRLEAAGRLSKRLTASRSVFKLRYKGGLKNLDSSRKNMSSVILRGNANSNVQYTLINNKTRNGSFGLKGWISGY